MTETSLAQRVSLLLSEQGLRKVDFARALGISPNYVSLLAGGRKKTISAPLARLIESTYGYRADWVLTGEEPVHPGDTLLALRADTVNRIRSLRPSELCAVADFLHSLPEADKPAHTAQQSSSTR